MTVAVSDVEIDDWAPLETDVREIGKQLPTLCNRLENSWIKQYLLVPQEQAEIQADIDRAIPLVAKVFKEVKALQASLEEEGSDEDVTALEGAMKALSTHRNAIERRIPSEKETSLVFDIVVALSQLVGGIWYLLVYYKILVAAIASSPIVIGIAFITTLSLLLINTKQHIENQIIRIKAEEKKWLVKNYRTLITTFEENQEKMNTSLIRASLREQRTSFEQQSKEIAELKELLQSLSSGKEGIAGSTQDKNVGKKMEGFCKSVREMLAQGVPKEALEKLIKHTIETIKAGASQVEILEQVSQVKVIEGTSETPVVTETVESTEVKEYA